MIPPIKVGDVLRLKELDYCYGVGDLVLRVTAPPRRTDDPEWADITGVEIYWNGREGVVRDVRVRVSALRNARGQQES